MHQQEIGRISFKGAVDLLRQWLPQAAACHGQPRKLAKWHDELLEAIASVQNPPRPGRQEPRAKKRRPKNYQLPTKPRHSSRVREPLVGDDVLRVLLSTVAGAALRRWRSALPYWSW